VEKLMENEINSETTKRLNTWLPVEVFEAITEYAKSNCNAMGKWDYGMAFRILLMKAQYADTIFEMNKRIDDIENKLQSQPVKEENKDVYTQKTWGDITKHGDKG